MSKKNKKSQQQISSTPATSSPQPHPSSESFVRQMTFDSIEDQIRGEEMLQHEENKNLKEAQDVKKKLDAAEVDRRLEELRKKILKK